MVTPEKWIHDSDHRSVSVLCVLAEKEEEYTEKFANPYQAAQFGYIDDVIEPRNTRFRICRALAQLDIWCSP